MASIRIHADIANFERKRKGFTSRQLGFLAIAAGVFIGIYALTYFVFGLGLDVGLYIAIIPALFFVLCAFFKIADMNFEIFCAYFLSHLRRGRVFFYEPNVDMASLPNKGEKDREFRKTWSSAVKEYRRYERSCRRRGFECSGK